MPQIFRMGEYWTYFWTNENRPVEPIHVHIAKGSLLKMQQRYGLLVRGNLCSAIIIQGYLHTRCVILFRNGLYILERYVIIADSLYSGTASNI